MKTVFKTIFRPCFFAGLRALAALAVLSALPGCPMPGDGPPPFVAVSGVTGVPDRGVCGEELDLGAAEVTPPEATNKAVVWTLVDGGASGLDAGNLSDARITPPAAGRLKLRAVVRDGKAPGADYTRDFSVSILPGRDFVAVSGITRVPGAGVKNLELDLGAAEITPPDATYRTIVWTLVDAGTTGILAGDLAGGRPVPSAPGILIVQALVAGGAGGEDYTEEFTIVVAASVTGNFVPVNAITGVPVAGEAGTELDLNGARVSPGTASVQAITWSVLDAGGTGITALGGGRAVPAGPGVLKLRALVKDGKGPGMDYTRDFEITITAPPITDAAPLTADIKFRKTGDNAASFDTNAWSGDGTAKETWLLTALGQGTVYFGAIKAPAQTITVSGPDAARVKIAEDGTNIDGSAAGDTLALFTVDARDTLFAGGTKRFTLEVSEAQKSPKTVAVTLNLAPDLTGVAVFRVLADPTPTIAGDETLEQVSGLKKFDLAEMKFDTAPADCLLDALAWIDRNAEDNGDYLVRIEKDEAIHRVILTCLKKDNVTVRLRGSGTERRVSYADNTSLIPGSSLPTYYNPAEISKSSINSWYGVFNVGTGAGVTLQLEAYVTLLGIDRMIDNPARGLLEFGSESSLKMLSGSKITGNRSNTLICLKTAAKEYGFFMYAGAEISGNTVHVSGETAQLIYFEYQAGTFYKEKGARVMDNVDDAQNEQNKVSFSWHGDVFDIGDSARTYRMSW
jgi:hypothetical protein